MPGPIQDKLSEIANRAGERGNFVYVSPSSSRSDCFDVKYRGRGGAVQSITFFCDDKYSKLHEAHFSGGGRLGVRGSPITVDMSEPYQVEHGIANRVRAAQGEPPIEYDHFVKAVNETAMGSDPSTVVFQHATWDRASNLQLMANVRADAKSFVGELTEEGKSNAQEIIENKDSIIEANKGKSFDSEQQLFHIRESRTYDEPGFFTVEYLDGMEEPSRSLFYMDSENGQLFYVIPSEGTMQHVNVDMAQEFGFEHAIGNFVRNYRGEPSIDYDNITHSALAGDLSSRDIWEKAANKQQQSLAQGAERKVVSTAETKIERTPERTVESSAGKSKPTSDTPKPKQETQPKQKSRKRLRKKLRSIKSKLDIRKKLRRERENPDAGPSSTINGPGGSGGSR